MLLGCFRTGDANDPEVYAAAVTAVLGDYPEDVIDAVIDPRRGLPSRAKWLPTVAEVKEACEAEMAPRRRAEMREAIKRERVMRLPAPPHQRPTMGEMKVKYGDKWGISQDDHMRMRVDSRWSSPTDDELREIYGGKNV